MATVASTSRTPIGNMSYVTAYHPSRMDGIGNQSASFSPTITGQYSRPGLERSQTESTLTSAASVSTVVIEENNIVNRKGGVNNSLYRSSLALKRRLAEVPGFDRYLIEMDLLERESDDETDPVTSMWNLLRRGIPLMAIYNALQPKVPLQISSMVNEAKVGKVATFKFLEACLEELKFPASECFLITDLYGEDTTGFVKVLRVINRVLDVLEERGVLLHTEDPSAPDGDAEQQPRSHAQKIVDELVSTESDYVQHLETLQQFKNQLEESGVIPGDVIHDVFLNLNALLDFQRRFLIRIEQQYSLDTSAQNWGQLFVQYQESFRVYEPFIANQNRCNDTVTREWDKIKSAPLSPAFQGMVETKAVLGGFLMKPFTRLTKYPMLLKELKKKGNLSPEKVEDLDKGCEATSSILARADQAIDRESRHAALQELHARVEDWKHHQIENFGELILYGDHTVLKANGAKEVEREYKLYLFENILLCCKEVSTNKTKNRLGTKVVDKKAKPRLQLRGRIFMQNVTNIIMEHGTLWLQIFWKSDPGMENFMIRFANEEMRNKWHHHVLEQKNMLTGILREAKQSNGTSDTEFTYTRNLPNMLNPYDREMDNYDDDERTLVGSPPPADFSGYSSSRNASSSSLRLKTTTGIGSASAVPHLNRVPPPRFPLPETIAGPNGPPLTVATTFPAAMMTPDEHAAHSYFSPSVESPVSTRSSSQAGMYPFPNQPAPVSNGWVVEENKHNTAPPMGRGPHRDDLNSYTVNGRTYQRPSLPVMTSTQQQLAQSRLRSQSSPDIQNTNSSTERRYPNGQLKPPIDMVPVPPIPYHMLNNRSQTNSPVESLRGIRTATQSPILSRPAPHQYPTQYGYEASQQPLPRSDPRSNGHTTPLPTPHLAPRGPPPNLQTLTLQDDEIPCPSQLKVKIFFDPAPSHVTIVVNSSIKHRSLIDRIDSKMEKVTSSSIAKGSARLRYVDSEDDFVTINCDEDVKMAIQEWAEVHEDMLRMGNTPDFQLHWVEIH